MAEFDLAVIGAGAAGLSVTAVAAQSLLARAREAFRDRWLADARQSNVGADQHD